MSFETLGLSAELLRAVAGTGYENPTPVQCEAIPEVLAGRDIMAGAQTGTGKTAAFALPILNRLQAAGSKRGPRAPRVLVLTPTRELAAQVAESFKTYGRHLDVETTVVFGGVNINPQITALRRGVDILVATPGRLLDHAGQRTVDLSRVETLVLDEADRMLDMGFIHDIRRVLKLLPAQRQNLLFSATFPDTILDLCNNMLKSPARIQVARRNATAEGIEQIAHPVDRSRKRDLLSSLMADGNWRQVLVFTRTKHGANRLAQQLEQDGFTAAAIHGNKSQAARTKALAGFKSGDVRVLVATDIAARGLDIDQLPHVVNYDLPTVPEDYVHRIGRTGRAGNEGSAVSLVDRDERDLLRAIERLQKREIPLTVVPGFEPGTAAPRDERPPVAAEVRDREFNANRGGGRDRPRDRFGGSRDRAAGARNQQSGQRSGPRPHAGNGGDSSAHRGNVVHRGNGSPARGAGVAGNVAPRTNAPQAGSPSRDADGNTQARSSTRTTRSFRPGRQLRGY